MHVPAHMRAHTCTHTKNIFKNQTFFKYLLLFLILWTYALKWWCVHVDAAALRSEQAAGGPGAGQSRPLQALEQESVAV